MSVLPILKWPDARLTQTCAPVTDVAAVSELIDDMFETMYDAPGRGLAAPQVGQMLRLFVMDATWKEGDMNPIACINPQWAPLNSETVASAEGCLSIPGVETVVQRYERIELRFIDLKGVARIKELTGFAARCAQHEMDHLDGVVTLHRLDEGARIAALAEYGALE